MRAIADAGYITPTAVQAKAIPLILAGGDVMASAQTGTGKTAAFTLPILHHLLEKPSVNNNRSGFPRCLILTPTRELAAQVEESVKTYGKYTSLKTMVMYGGVSIFAQIKSLRRHIDIVVSTPGRLLDHITRKTLDLSGVEVLVLDEADRMLDMGFIRDIKKITALLPKQRQNLLLSATFSEEIKSLSKGILHNPVFVEVTRRNTPSELVEQSVHLVQQRLKSHLLSHIIRHYDWKQVLVFTRTKNGANKLTEKLLSDGISSAAIHSNKSQPARTKALTQFKNGSLSVLVATDIVSRGLDIDHLPHVVNFELPNVAEDYIHRIGRTGRAGSAGAAISLVDREELQYLKEIERVIKREIPKVVFDSFVPPANLPAEVQNSSPRRQNMPRRTASANFNTDNTRTADTNKRYTGTTANRADNNNKRYAGTTANRAGDSSRGYSTNSRTFSADNKRYTAGANADDNSRKTGAGNNYYTTRTNNAAMPRTAAPGSQNRPQRYGKSQNARTAQFKTSRPSSKNSD
ncbi:MAG: DEAD/DEAH box helicase [Candidatus Acididesulfobacter guangdongensis]|uniref:DEAD/DEAH box helicase n=1 Tax=Acididesulfobacter guangdongensis TaxID=2597225 RepID=A0A519BJJ0_ACIG2|nr:MAG: DEAD/DEAH box helicase [Candidatus Acididesulfobacter guangdongensis]